MRQQLLAMCSRSLGSSIRGQTLMLLQLFFRYVTIMHQCQPLPLPYGAGSESEISGDLRRSVLRFGEDPGSMNKYGRLTLHLIHLIAPW